MAGYDEIERNKRLWFTKKATTFKISLYNLLVLSLCTPAQNMEALCLYNRAPSYFQTRNLAGALPKQ